MERIAEHFEQALQQYRPTGVSEKTGLHWSVHGAEVVTANAHISGKTR
jgi:hypothetical protein